MEDREFLIWLQGLLVGNGDKELSKVKVLLIKEELYMLGKGDSEDLEFGPSSDVIKLLDRLDKIKEVKEAEKCSRNCTCYGFVNNPFCPEHPDDNTLTSIWYTGHGD